MVKINFVTIVAIVILTPSVFAIPITNDADYLQERMENIEVRSPRFGFFKKLKKIVTPSNIRKVASVASNFIRDEYPQIISGREICEDDVEDFVARDAELMDDFDARDPSFGSFFRKVKKIARPIERVASVATSVLAREDDEIIERETEIPGLDDLE